MAQVIPIKAAYISKKLKLPLYISKIPAGFPSPADDYIDQKLDLNEYLVKKPSATFFVKVQGHSMKDVGIHDGDLLIVDRSLTATHKSIIVASLNGEFTVKRLLKKDGKVFLKPENQSFKLIEVTNNEEFEVFGVVAHVIHTPK